MYFRKLSKKILKSKLVICCLSFLIYIYSKFVGLTCKWKIKKLKNATKAAENTNAIWVAWHARATMMPFFWQKFFDRIIGRYSFFAQAPDQDLFIFKCW